MEVLTSEKHDENNAHDEGFNEFDEDPDYKYSSTANKAKNLMEDDVDDTDEADLEIRSPTGAGETGAKAFKAPANMPPVRFAYCVSCGYRQAFDQFSQIIQEKYPGVVIEGANFPPTQIKAFVSQFIGVAKIALIVMVIVGRDPFASMGIATPGIFNWMLSNKLSSCLMLFMLSNSIEGMMMSTGAFEIYLGEEQIWSKLESGRVPSPVELIQAIDSSLAIKGNKISGSFGFENE
uniref:SelT-like protein n=1 Tax=Ditylenchus dipsaci TaxID=166011 RepID=A0A915DH52_9BILA